MKPGPGPGGEWTGRSLLALQIALQVYWVGGGLAGVLVGTLLPTRIEGLEFMLTALFITLTLDACRSLAQVPSLLLAATSLAVAAVITPDSLLLVSLLLFMALLTLRFVWRGTAHV